MFFDHSQPEEPAIDRVRSIYATKFLQSGGDILLFIDDDILYTPDCVYQLIRDCLETRSIVIGAYVKKCLPADKLVFAPLRGEVSFEFGKGKLHEIKWAGTGFMAIHVDVLKRMAQELPLCNEKDIPVIPFFLPMVKEDPELGWIYISEDFAFCDRAREMGCSVWMNTGIVLGHDGHFCYMIGQAVPEKAKVIDK